MRVRIRVPNLQARWETAALLMSGYEPRPTPSRALTTTPTMRCRAVHARELERRVALPFADQKLKVAIRSMRRLAEEFENDPPCNPLGVSKNRDPRIPLGLPKFTLLKRFRAEAPMLRL